MFVSAFERLGLPAQYAVDIELLERLYLEKSRLCHPDHNAQSGPETLAQALSDSAALNEAHSVLADPMRRAEHLLALWGGPDASADKRQPPEFLEKMLDWREEAENPAAREMLLNRLEIERSELLKRIFEQFAHPGEVPSDRVVRMKEIRLLLNQLRSVQGLLRELEDSY
jgi:molecular chaperone HscB